VPTRAAAVAAAVLTLAACGGGGGGPQLSRDQFVAKADAICSQVATQRKALTPPTRLPDIPAYVSGYLPALDSGLKKLKALRPPADMQSGVKDWLKAVEETRGLLSDLGSAAKKGDAAAVAKVGAESTSVNSRRQAAARSLGLTSCSTL
jgi:hypothetical protein